MQKEVNCSMDELIMEIICKTYSYMDEDACKHWSIENAKDVVHDLKLYDKEKGWETLPYDANDFYDTIKEFIKQDYPKILCD